MSELIIQATSVGDNTQHDHATDDLKLAALIACEDAACAYPTSNFTFCQTMYIHGYGHTPTTNYTLTYTDPPTPATVRRSVVRQADVYGEIEDNYPIVYNDETGTWTVADTMPASITVNLEPDGNLNTILPFATNFLRYNLTANVGVNSLLNNTNDGGHYLGSTFRTVIVNNAENQYWTGSTSAAYTAGTGLDPDPDGP